MEYSVLILPVVAPVLFWAWYHYRSDRHLPEPLPFLVLAFSCGIGAFGIGKAMYAALGFFDLRFDAFLLAETNRPALLAYALLAIGPIEEIAKLLPFLAIVRLVPAFDEPIDGIVYGSFIALGFAATENVVYFPFLESSIALARGFVAPVVHIVFASIWGYYVGRAALRGRLLSGATFASVGGTALLHGFYDYLVLALPFMALPASALLVAAIWLWRLFLIRDLQREAGSI